MLRESHRTSTYQSTAAVLILVAVYSAMPQSGALAFNFGRHQKATTSASTDNSAEGNSAEGNVTGEPEQKQENAAEEKAAPATVKPPETKSKKPEVIERTDFSGQFHFVLPDGWRTHQIPFQTHDVLSVREKDGIAATISFADELGKKSLDSLKASTIEESQKAVKKYELVDSKLTTLPGGQPCAKIVSLEEIDEVATRQVQYIVGLKKKHYLICTLTVAKDIGEKYDKLLQDVVASIFAENQSDKTKK